MKSDYRIVCILLLDWDYKTSSYLARHKLTAIPSCNLLVFDRFLLSPYQGGELDR